MEKVLENVSLKEIVKMLSSKKLSYELIAKIHGLSTEIILEIDASLHGKGE